MVVLSLKKNWQEEFIKIYSKITDADLLIDCFPLYIDVGDKRRKITILSAKLKLTSQSGRLIVRRKYFAYQNVYDIENEREEEE
jgi:hypothetical protein